MPARITVTREEAGGGPAGEVEVQAIETHSTLDTLDDLPTAYAAPGDGVGLFDGSTAITFTAFPSSDIDDTHSGVSSGYRITWINNQTIFAATTYELEYISGAYSRPSLSYD